jgi:hypothetical protein
MLRTKPLITSEELHCLLGGARAQTAQHFADSRRGMTVMHFGALLWVVKGIFLYAMLQSPDVATLIGSSRYLWMRGLLELLCLSVFLGAAMHRKGRMVAYASLLVASTSGVMDAMAVLTLAA